MSNQLFERRCPDVDRPRKRRRRTEKYATEGFRQGSTLRSILTKLFVLQIPSDSRAEISIRFGSQHAAVGALANNSGPSKVQFESRTLLCNDFHDTVLSLCIPMMSILPSVHDINAGMYPNEPPNLSKRHSSCQCSWNCVLATWFLSYRR